MRIYTYSQARQNLAEVLNQAREQEVIIKRRSGEEFVVVPKPPEKGSPFDVPGVDTRATTGDILSAVRASRAR